MCLAPQVEPIAEAPSPPKPLPAVNLEGMDLDALRKVGDSTNNSDDRWANVAEAPKVLSLCIVQEPAKSCHATMLSMTNGTALDSIRRIRQRIDTWLIKPAVLALLKLSQL